MESKRNVERRTVIPPPPRFDVEPVREGLFAGVPLLTWYTCPPWTTTC